MPGPERRFTSVVATIDAEAALAAAVTTTAPVAATPAARVQATREFLSFRESTRTHSPFRESTGREDSPGPRAARRG